MLDKPDPRLRRVLEQVDDPKRALAKERMRSSHLKRRPAPLVAQRAADAKPPDQRPSY